MDTLFINVLDRFFLAFGNVESSVKNIECSLVSKSGSYNFIARHRADWMLAIGLCDVLTVFALAIWAYPTPFSTTLFGLSIIILSHGALAASLILVVFGYRYIPHTIYPKLGMITEVVAIVTLHALDPREFYIYEALIVVWSAQLPYFFSVRTSILFGGCMLLVATAIRVHINPQNYFVYQFVLHIIFNVFTIISSRNAMSAERGREILAQRNAELEATRELLDASAKEGERLRIARDLHDTIGHHLTALCLRLELAQHQDADDSKIAQEQAHHIAKLLLADVRATVSRMRSSTDTNLYRLINTLTYAIPRLKIVKEIPENLETSDSRIAEVIYRVTQEVITNTIRHSGALHLHLQLNEDDSHIRFMAYDDGKLDEYFDPGNGLRGIQERVFALNGQIQIDRTEDGAMRIALALPKERL